MTEHQLTPTTPRRQTPRRRRLAIAGLLLATPFVAACGDFDIDIESDTWPDIDGSGDVVTTEVAVEDFHRIDVSDQFRVVATVSDGADPSVSFDVDDNLVEHVDIRVDGKTLVVEFDQGGIDPSERPVVTVTIDELLSVETSGASEIVVSGVDGPDFDVDASGASRVEAAGTTTNLTIQASGASNLDLFDLQSASVDVDLSGASSADVTASDQVAGKASGASSVDIIGDASIDVSTSGASSVNHRS